MRSKIEQESEVSTEGDQNELKIKSEDSKGALQDHGVEIHDAIDRWGRAVWIIGGVLLAGYLLTKIGFEQNPKVSRKRNLPATLYSSGGSGIFNSVIEQIALFLLAIAKEKLAEFVKENK